jgi:hypothetical protein
LELKAGFGVIQQRAPALQLFQLGAHVIQLAHAAPCFLLVIPEIGLAGQLLQVALAGSQGGNVKGSPGLCPGGR